MGWVVGFRGWDQVPKTEENASADAVEAKRTTSTDSIVNHPLIPHLLVGLPLLHLLSLSAYLWAYTVGFEANIVSLITSDDIFRVTISDMVRAYIVVGGGAIVLYLMQRYLFYRSVSIKAISAKDVIIRLGVHVVAWVAFVALVLTSDDDPRPGWEIIFVAMTGAITLQNVVLPWTRNRNRAALLMTAFLFFLFSISEGLDAGHQERVMTYKDSRKKLACKEMRILRGFSEYYIAVRRDNSKVVIGKECGVQFVIE